MNAELELLDDDEALDGAQMVPMPVSGTGAVDLPRVERAVEELLSALGYSVRSESLSATPRRVARKPGGVVHRPAVLPYHVPQ